MKRSLTWIIKVALVIAPFGILAGIAGCGWYVFKATNLQVAYADNLKLIEASNQDVKQFKASFPNSQCSISYFSEVAGTPRYQCKTFLHDRYILYLHAPLKKNEKGEFEPTTISYTLWEVKSVAEGPNGTLLTSYETMTNRFDSTVASFLVTNEWNFSRSDFLLKTNSPVANFSLLMDR